MRPVRICVAWFQFSLNGSIGRFVRFARALAPFGHEVEFLSLTGQTDTDWPDFPGPVLGPRDVSGRNWDAVMVPGAGNPSNPLELLAGLKHERYGRRIQHVLNDTARIDRFREVNRILDPHVVAFNNGHWAPSDYRTFSASAFRRVPGAVDTRRFRPAPMRALPAREGRWTIGAFAKKNLAPVLDAVDRLSPEHVLHVFGTVPGELRPRVDTMIAAGRVVPRGTLHGDELVAFYRGLDVMITTETGAGWCNPAAEAMACGIPSIVSRHGTIDFVDPGCNAIVLESIDGETIAREIGGLTAAPDRMRELAGRATDSMGAFDWTEWSARTLGLVTEPISSAYYRIPELGLHGKWEPEIRLEGLTPLLEEADGASVLDLGSAEGIVSVELARRGASRVHAFEKEPDRVRVGGELLARSPGLESSVREADLSDWPQFECAHGDVLEDGYDIVLFLGLYHHLPKTKRLDALRGAMARSRKWLAVRTPPALARDDRLVDACEEAGFQLVGGGDGSAEGNLGWLGLFRRTEEVNR